MSENQEFVDWKVRCTYSRKSTISADNRKYVSGSPVSMDMAFDVDARTAHEAWAKAIEHIPVEILMCGTVYVRVNMSVRIEL